MPRVKVTLEFEYNIDLDNYVGEDGKVPTLDDAIQIDREMFEQDPIVLVDMIEDYTISVQPVEKHPEVS